MRLGANRRQSVCLFVCLFARSVSNLIECVDGEPTLVLALDMSARTLSALPITGRSDRARLQVHRTAPPVPCACLRAGELNAGARVHACACARVSALSCVRA
jgi:hypothetical protein